MVVGAVAEWTFGISLSSVIWGVEVTEGVLPVVVLVPEEVSVAAASAVVLEAAALEVVVLPEAGSFKIKATHQE